MNVHIFRCGFMHQHIGIKHSQQRGFFACLFIFVFAFFVSFCKSAARSLLLIHWSCAKLGDQDI